MADACDSWVLRMWRGLSESMFDLGSVNPTVRLCSNHTSMHGRVCPQTGWSSERMPPLCIPKGHCHAQWRHPQAWDELVRCENMGPAR